MVDDVVTVEVPVVVVVTTVVVLVVVLVVELVVLDVVPEPLVVALVELLVVETEGGGVLTVELGGSGSGLCTCNSYESCLLYARTSTDRDSIYKVARGVDEFLAWMYLFWPKRALLSVLIS